MSAFGALDRGTRIAILLLGGTAVAGVGYLGWQMLQPPVVVETAAEPQAEAAPDPTAAPAAGPAADPAKSAPAAAAKPDPAPGKAETTAAETGPVLPLIDTWRVAADGQAVVSGSAAPGATVEVVVDDVTVASGAATASGEFAILFTLAPNPKPSLMWLSMLRPGLPAVASEEMVALGPVEGPKPADPARDKAASETAAAAPPAAPPALLLSEEGAVVLQDPAVPEPAAGPEPSVMIDTISYTPDGEVQVGGRGAGGASLRIYLDNAEKVTVAVPASGRWVTTLPDTPPGIYTLRVDQLDAAGKVTSRFETPFKRETVEALAEVAGAEAADAAEASAAVVAAPAQPVAAPSAEATAEATAEAATETATETAAATATPDAAAPEASAEAETAATAASQPVTVTVQPGFTLWGIAQDRMGEGVMYVQVFEANRDKIKDPDLIYPGQVFTMPAAAAPP